MSELEACLDPCMLLQSTSSREVYHSATTSVLGADIWICFHLVEIAYREL